jgi:stearoyl-CoA desaturase (delta-9 desaturase)
VTLGEGWHNNHHFYPASTSQGFFWWELDVSFLGLRALAALRLVSGLRTAPDRVRRAHVERGLSPLALPDPG